MSNTIRFRSINDDGDIELFVEFQSGSFCGKSSAWLPMKSIILFAEKLNEFPIREDSPPEIIGGVWNTEGTQIVHGLVDLSVKPSGNRGQLAILIRLTELDEGGHDVKRSGFASIDASYQEIEQVRRAITEAIHATSERSVVFQDFA